MKKTIILVFFLAISKCYGLTAAFNTTVSSGCVPLVVDFTDASVGGPISWSYDFDDGGTSTAQNPRYTFTKPGNFRVELTAFDGATYSTYSVVISVKKLPNVNFSIPKSSWCPGEAISFTNLTQVGDTTIRSSSWDFGDGNVVSNNGNVSKTYNLTGSFTVKMTVRDNFNCVSTLSKTNFVTINPKPNPVFNYTSKYSCVAPQRINFVNNSSNSVSFQWDFGDGNTSTQYNPIIFYDVAKNYTVKLTATSDKGCVASSSMNIPVAFGKIKSDYSAAAFTGCIPFDPKFKNNSTPVGAKFDYLWDFGDGTKSTLENPNKTYSKIGTYQVKLRISGNGAGCADSIVKTMLISDKPKAIISTKDTLSCNGILKNVFKAKSNSDIDNYTWFIDGKNIDTKVDTLEYNFPDEGIYNVVVMLRDKAGCQQTFQFPKIVVQNMWCGFMWGEAGGCIPYSPKLIDTSDSELPAIFSYFWDDGKGGTYNVQHPTIVYDKEGKYELKLKIKDQYGCEDEAWNFVKAGTKIKPNFKVDKYVICNNEDIRMDNTTPDSLRKKVDSWLWEFGIAKGSNENTFITSIRDYPKKYSPLLISIRNECRDTCIKEDSITIKPTLADFVYSFDTCFSNTGKLRHTSVVATDFTWYLPDGSTSKDSIIYHKFKPKLAEKFKVIASNKLTGCVDTLKQEISAPVSTSNVTMTKRTGCTPQIFFVENANTRAYRSHWDFGNGDTSALNDTFQYVFHTPGKYVIKHTGWDIRSCPYQSQTIITVDGPTANAKIWPDRGCIPLKIQLVDSVSNGKVKRKYWKFEDDPQWRKATNKNETIDYTINSMPMSGDSFFNIELFVEDSNGCQSTRVFKVRPSGPRAGIQLNPDSRCDAVEYGFRANIDSFSAVYPIDILWTLGDGNSKKTDAFKHIYEKGGKYKVNVTLTDGLGCKFEEQLNLNASDPEILAKFSANNTTAVCPPLITTFKDESISDPNNLIVSYYWDFGDGTSSSLRNPSKIYTNPGKFNVTLTVRNQFGCSNTTKMEQFIQVGGPLAIYNFNPREACLPLKASFSAQATKGTSVEWDFGNGYTFKGSKAEYVYEKSGTYYPKLLLKDSGGCATVLVPNDSIIARPSPKSGFTFNSNCLDDEISFINQSSSNDPSDDSLKYSWFVDGDTLHTEDFKKRFIEKGMFEVKLKVENIHQCQDSISIGLVISKPISEFEIKNEKICTGDSLLILDKSKSDNGIKHVKWLVDDVLTQGSRIFLPKGDFKISSIITDTFNCKDTSEYINSIHVADTIAPETLQIHRVSHLNDNLLELKFEVSKDIDFEEYQLYEFINGQPSLLNKYDDISEDSINIVLSQAKTSHCYVITQSNYCKSVSRLSVPHCNIHVETVAQNNANQVKWNPYTAWSVARYIVEREDIEVPGTFVKIGETDANTPNFTDSMVVCKRNHSYRIYAEGPDFEKYSYSDTSRSKAIWVNTIPAPTIDLISVLKDTSINIQWKKDLNYQRSEYSGTLIMRENWQGLKTMNLSSDSSSFTDKFVHVDLNRYRYYVAMTDNCKDTGKWSMYSENILLKSYRKNETDAPSLIWNAYRHWNSGVSQYEVQRMEEDGSFTTLAFTNDTFYIDEGSQNSCLKAYRYRVLAISRDNKEVVSFSNTIRIKPVSRLYVPNAFTPNGNKLNEIFAAKGQYLYDYNLEIYNQWGEKLFETDECMEGWDGTYKGENAAQGVYYYRISAKGTDGQLYIKSGTMMLLK